METEPSKIIYKTDPAKLFVNSLAIRLHQIPHSLVVCMIKIANWCFQLGLAFLHLGGVFA